MNQLIHLIYASAATVQFDDSELIALLSQARRYNASIDVTGMLLHCEGSFFQVLEGPESAIIALFKIISADPRHNRITTIIKEPISERAFSQWSMAFLGTSQNQVASIDGLNDFFIHGTCLADLDRGRAKKLLQAFSQGRWRQALAVSST